MRGLLHARSKGAKAIKKRVQKGEQPSTTHHLHHLWWHQLWLAICNYLLHTTPTITTFLLFFYYSFLRTPVQCDPLINIEEEGSADYYCSSANSLVYAAGVLGKVIGTFGDHFNGDNTKMHVYSTLTNIYRIKKVANFHWYTSTKCTVHNVTCCIGIQHIVINYQIILCVLCHYKPFFILYKF